MLGWALPSIWLVLLTLGIALWFFTSAGGFSLLELAIRQRSPRSEQTPPVIREEMPLEVDGTRCVLCRLCVDFCPTGAFELTRNHYTYLTFKPSDCIGCGLCTRLCPTEAISFQPESAVVNSAPAPSRQTPVAWQPPDCGHQLPPAGVSQNAVLSHTETSCPQCADQIEALTHVVRERLNLP